MSLHDKDYLLRSIRQLVNLVAALLGKKQPKQIEEARGAVGEAGRQSFGPLWSTLLAQGPDTALMLLGDRDKAEAFALLVEQKALVEEAAGNERLARSHRALVEGVRARLARDEGD
ncbi:MAG TPA: hypothetical protein VFS43_00585 [Polyangiaceae bacterium]|nr:hypothetical protein [Polyangiaceae bacterium]